MITNNDLKKIGLSGFTIALFIFLNTLLSVGKFLHFHLSKRGSSRILNYVSQGIKNDDAEKKNVLKALSNHPLVTQNRPNLPFGCKESDLANKLSKKELDQKLRKCFTNYITKEYAKWSKNKLPKDERDFYSSHCNKKLILNLKGMEYSSRCRFIILMKLSLISYLKFPSFIKLNKNIWKLVIEGDKHKCSKLLKKKSNGLYIIIRG
ncbi:hypothetical protein MKS88_001404 [Plasmodium brasilianum]|uniref:RAD protein n=2 Tax=Plasmodium (Plasmodium) TaxID=418103 RepID=A0A1A8X502_PLAMA|nr:hypothetical protein MKS88_001404 [Plasmodium brasilianum]SBT00353.1 RAD protein [Plasmodium malariae]